MLDQMMIDWALDRELPVHVLLTKADKLSRSENKNTVTKVLKHYELMGELLTAQSFSSLKKEGLSQLITQLNHWFAWPDDKA
jgi:GTP-binding protein